MLDVCAQWDVNVRGVGTSRVLVLNDVVVKMSMVGGATMAWLALAARDEDSENLTVYDKMEKWLQSRQ